MKRILLLLFSFPFLLFAQSDEPRYLRMIGDSAEYFNFYEIQAEYGDYFATRDKGRGSGYKQIMRFENFVERRLAPSGNMFNIPGRNLNNYNSYLNSFNFSTLPNDYDPGNWESVGHSNFVQGTGWSGGIGRINCIEFSSNGSDCFVGAPAGGVWKTTGQWVNWEPITDGLPNIGNSGIGVSPSNSNNIFILTGDGDGYGMSGVGSIGVLETNDGGTTWQPTSLTWSDANLVRGFKLLVHPTNVNVQYVVVAKSGNNFNGIYRTANAWNSFTKVDSSNGFFDIEFKPGDPTTIYATGQNTFYISTNNGLNFTQQTAGVNLPINAFIERVAVAVTPADPATVYLLYGDRQNNAALSGFGLYRSTNSGGTFTLMSSGVGASPNILGNTAGTSTSTQADYDIAIAVSPQDVSEIHVGGINMWVSNDTGVTWIPTSDWKSDGTTQTGMCNCTNGYTHADIHALEYHPTNGALYCGSDGGFYRTQDQAATWVDRSAGLEISMLYAIDLFSNNSNIVIGGTQDNGSNTWNFTNNTLTHDRGADGFGCIADNSNTNTWFMTTQSGLQRTTNGGTGATPYTSISPPSTYNAAGFDMWDVAVVQHTTNSNTIFSAERAGALYMSTSATANNLNWMALPTGNAIVNGWPGNRFFNGCVAQGVSNDDRMYAASVSNIFMTPNVNDVAAGASTSNWNDITAGLPVASAAITGVAVNPNASWEATVVFSGYNAAVKVYETTNCGGQCNTSTAWTDITGSLPNVPINCVIYDPGNTAIDAVYIGTDVGVFYRDNNIGDWVPFFHGLPNVVVEDLEIENNQIVAGTYGRGIWRSNLYGNCLSTIALTQTNNQLSSSNNAQTYYAASNWITSERTVFGGSIGDSVRYQGGNYVKLLPGFKAQSGSNFKAKIGQCDPNVSSPSSARYMSVQDAIIYRCYGALVP